MDSGPALASAKMSQRSDGNLQISDVSEDDSNIYTCSVRHSNRSIRAELEVLSKSKSMQTYHVSHASMQSKLLNVHFVCTIHKGVFKMYSAIQKFGISKILMFFKEVSYAHQGCLYLIKIT